MHELTTNAGKYGALTNGDGCVGIIWHAAGEEGRDEAFVISWAERNGPPVAPPSRRVGSTVISRLAEASLEATVDLDYAPSGFFWRLECPAKNIVGP